ncbi:MAG: hypothetical protein RR678_06070 [Lachnospiraceae bacterium]
MKTLFESYTDILKENSKWNPTRNLNIEYVLPNVLKSLNSYNFIFEILFYDGNTRSLALDFSRYSELIPKERYSHTVSLYLLGIQVAEAIGFKQFDLPIWDNCSQRNFLHHWATTCLYHDIAYCIEQSNDEFIPVNNQTLDIISDNLGLQYNLSSKDTIGIIERYYQYRITAAKPTIDHGIIGAMMLYDSLLKRNNKMEKIAETAIIVCDKPMYGEENKANILKYALDIARHNMWFAFNTDDIEKYESLGLNNLIARSDGSHKISFKKEPMLFLLCLIDTIDPIKAYSKKEPETVIRAVCLSSERVKDELKIVFDDCFDDKMKKKAQGCDTWLNVSVRTHEASRCSICFDIK